MATPTLTEYLNTLYTTTWAYRRPGIVDQVFEANKLLLLYKSKGMLKTEPTSGRRVEIPLRINKSTTAKFFAKGTTFTITDIDPATVAYDDWKNLGDQVVRYWVDDKANGTNRDAHLKWLNLKIDTVKESLMEKLEDALWSSQGGSSVLDYNGIQHLISATPSSSLTVHGIDQSTAVSGSTYYWRNQQKTSSGAFSIYGESDMTNILNTCQRWGKIDCLISDQTTYELGEAEALERIRVVNQEAVSLGLDHITFKGRPWVWSPKCTTGYTYLLDRSHIGMIVDPAANMSMGSWKELPTNYGDMVAQIVQRGQHFVDKRQCHGVITGQAA